MSTFEQPPLFDLGAGETLRDNGVTAAGSTNPQAPAWRADAEAAIEVLAQTRTVFSADNLVAIVGPPPIPNMLGAVFLSASRAGLIVCTGFRPAQRPTAHARMQRTWIGT